MNKRIVRLQRKWYGIWEINSFQKRYIMRLLTLSTVYLLSTAVHAIDLPLELLVEAQTYCVNDSLSEPEPDINGSLDSIPHCVSFANGKAIYTPRGGMLANTPLLEIDYNVSATDSFEVFFDPQKLYTIVSDDEIRSQGMVYRLRHEVPNPSYYFSTILTHRLLIDTRSLKENISIVVNPGPSDESEECSNLPARVALERDTIKTYEFNFSCGKGFGTYLEDGFVEVYSADLQKWEKASEFKLNTRGARGLSCSEGADGQVFCEEF